MNELNKNYSEAIRAIKSAILKSRYRAAALVNREMLSLYYGIGKYISENSRTGFWGTGAINTISERLQQELPGLRGFSATNMKNMRLFSEAWGDQFLETTNQTNKFRQIASDKSQGDKNEGIIIRQIPSDELSNENPSIGIILCKSQKQKTVEYAFRDMSKPMGVATYKTASELPPEYRNVLPDVERLKELL